MTRQKFFLYGPPCEETSFLTTFSSIHDVFLHNRLYLGRTDVTSFCVHFEQIGRGLLREGKRREGECAVYAKRRVMNRKFSHQLHILHITNHAGPSVWAAMLYKQQAVRRPALICMCYKESPLLND